MMSLSAANSPFQNKWPLFIVGLCAWFFFLGTQEKIAGSQISSFFLIYSHFLPPLISIFAIMSLFLLLSSIRSIFPAYARLIGSSWFFDWFFVLCLLSVLKVNSVYTGLISASAIFILARILASVGPAGLVAYSTAAIEVRREVKRIHWPSYAETIKFVGVVGAFVTVSSIFWWIIDGIITRVLSFLLHLLS